MIFWLKAVRDIRTMGMRALFVILVVGVGIGTAMGIALALEDVRATRDAFYRDYGLADLDLRLSRLLPDEMLLAEAKTAGTTEAEPRLILNGSTQLGQGNEPAAQVVGMDPAAKLNRLAVVAGQPLSADSPTDALLEADFAKHAHLGVGDKLRLVVQGQPMTLHIRGLARSPEYLLASADPQYLLPQPGSLAVVFMPREGLQELVGVGEQANDLAVNFPAGTPPERQQALASKLPVERSIPRSEQYSLLFTNADIHSFSTFVPVIGTVFAVVGLLLITLSLRRLVHSQRRELGSMLALGYKRRAVVLTVVLPAAMLAIVGAVFAVVVTIAIGRLVAYEYANAVGFPDVVYALVSGPLLIAAGVAAGATLLAAVVPAFNLTRLRPTEAMRGDPVASFELPGWLESATSRGGLPVTYAARTLLRRPLLTGVTVISLAAAIGLGAALNILMTSTNKAIDASFDQQAWTYSVSLASPLPVAEATELATQSGARETEPIVNGSARVQSADSKPVDITLVGLPAEPALERLTITAGYPPAQGRITLSEQTIDKLNAKVGDHVTITTSSDQATVVIAGTARTLAGTESFLPQAEAGALLGLPGLATGVFFTGGEEVAASLRRNANVARVTSKSAAIEGARDLMDELTILLNVLLAISLAVGALFLISSLALSFLDRESEFATLRAIGNGRRQIATIVATEALVQTTVAAALSIPAALLIAWPLARQIGKAWFHIGLSPEPSNFVYVILFAFVLALVAAWQAVRRVLRLNIATVVRTRLIG